MSRNEEIGNALARVIETGDTRTLFALLAPGSVVWHNHDRVEVDAKKNTEASAALRELVDDVVVEIIEQLDTTAGFVQRFQLRGTIKSNGARLVSHNCLVAKVEDGKLVRVDEYVDPIIVSAFS